MNVKGSLFIVFMLFASLGFAYTFPSCLSSYSISGANFTYSTAGQVYPCSIGTATPFGLGSLTQVGTINTTGSVIMVKVTAASGTATITINQPASSTTAMLVGSAVGGAHASIQCAANTSHAITTVNDETRRYNVTVNATDVLYMQDNLSTNMSCPISSNITLISINNGGVNSEAYLTLTTTSAFNELSIPSPDSSIAYVISANNYMSYNQITGHIVRSDFTTGFTFINASVEAGYCQSLLYFNNPYYGNIQLIPKITYIPGANAFADFINATSNSAYIPNNTISYIYDSVTSAWYIVPATICNSYSIVGSTSTLQYNPTGIGASVGGTVPFDVNSITGSCSYNTGTRLITCTGTDSSNTITSLGLSAYKIGNATDLCAQTAAGASGTLTCTLPNQNGTYNAYFYGTDADLLNHQFAYKQISIGVGSSGYGRDGYILTMLVFAVAACLMTSSISVSMILGCFGLFMALAFGILPWSDAPAIIFFAVVALVISYRLKI